MESSPLIVSGGELAEVFGVSRVMISKYRREGMWRFSPRHGEYDLDGCVRWLIRRRNLSLNIMYTPKHSNRKVRDLAAQLRYEKGREQHRGTMEGNNQ